VTHPAAGIGIDLGNQLIMVSAPSPMTWAGTRSAMAAILPSITKHR
jgi:hypothetical protein